MPDCRSCKNKISTDSNYCHQCGAKVIAERLTVKSLSKNLFLSITSLDFPFFKTFIELMISPKKVTIGYINGARKKYTSPVKFALIILSIYGVYQFLFNDFLQLISDQNFLSNIQEGWNAHPSEVEQDVQGDKAFNWLQKQYQFLILFTIPILAFFYHRFYKSKNYNLAEHLVISTYAISFTVLFSIILAFGFIPFGSEKAVKLYVSFSSIMQLFFLVWIVQRSLRGAIYKHPIVFLLTFVTFIFFFFITLTFLLTSSFL